MTTFGIGLYGEGLYGEGESPSGVEATTEIGSIVPGNSAALSGVQVTTMVGSFDPSLLVALSGVQVTTMVGSFDPSLLVALSGVEASSAFSAFSTAGFPGTRTFFVASTTEKVIAPGIVLLPTSEDLAPVFLNSSLYGIGLYGRGLYGGSSRAYVIGSSQFYTIGEVFWNGALQTKGVAWEFVPPFTHIIRILANPASITTPVTLVYYRWNIRVPAGFRVTSYPVPFSFNNTTIIAEQVPPLGQYFTVSFSVSRTANNPQTLFSIFPLMVDDMLADHTSYDGSKGFQTYRPNCYQVLDSTLMQVFEWSGSVWVAIGDIANGTSFYVKSLRAVYQNNDGIAVLKYTAGDGTSGDYPEVLTYPAFGEGIGKNLLVDGFSANASTQYPAAYQVCSTPGTYAPACEDQGFDEDFDFSFG